VRAHCRLDEAPTHLGFLGIVGSKRCDEGVVESEELGAGASPAHATAGVAVQPRQKPRAREQFEVVGKRDDVATLLHLAEHLLVGQNLARVETAKLE
jgi:hypothetical protein